MSNIHESGVWEGPERRMRQRNIPRNTGWFFSQFDKQGKSTHTPRSSVTPKGLTLSPIPENPRQRENDEPSQHGGRVESGQRAGTTTPSRRKQHGRKRKRVIEVAEAGSAPGRGEKGLLGEKLQKPADVRPLEILADYESAGKSPRRHVREEILGKKS